MNATKFYLPLQKAIAELNIDLIPGRRKKILESLVVYMIGCIGNGSPIRLLFVCTHNARRSQFAQAWASAAAKWFDIPCECFSGGTAVTRVHNNTIASLKSTGFRIEESNGMNPIFQVSMGDSLPIHQLYSKLIDEKANPHENFVAVMTCSDADESCPAVPGATQRIALHYDDPGLADNTENALAMYNERSKQIATELFYVFHRVKSYIE